MHQSGRRWRARLSTPRPPPIPPALTFNARGYCSTALLSNGRLRALQARLAAGLEYAAMSLTGTLMPSDVIDGACGGLFVYWSRAARSSPECKGCLPQYRECRGGGGGGFDQGGLAGRERGGQLISSHEGRATAGAAVHAYTCVCVRPGPHTPAQVIRLLASSPLPAASQGRACQPTHRPARSLGLPCTMPTPSQVVPPSRQCASR